MIFVLFFTALSHVTFAQYIAPVERQFTLQDTLRGSITPERAWWDLTYYHLDIAVNPSDSTINGTNTVTYRVFKPCGMMQIDLQEPLNLFKVIQNGNVLKFTREGNVYWIELADNQISGQINSVVLTYGGRPKVSLRPSLEWRDYMEEGQKRSSFCCLRMSG